MTKEDKNTLAAKLAALTENERKKLYQRAAKMRKLSQTKASTRPRRAYMVFDELEEPETELRQPKASLEEFVLRLLASEEPVEATGEAKHPVGTVIAIGPRTAEVALGGTMRSCILAHDIAERQQTDLAVGDEVEVVQRADTFVVEAVRPRRTKLSRPDPGRSGLERVIVANVDLVVVVTSVVSPPLHPRLIDRYLIAIKRGGAEAAICVNKLDLLRSPEEREQELAQLAPYRALGLPIIEASAADGAVSDAFGDLLRGKTCAFVGHSGVGKSSLLNVLRPDLGLKTGAVSDGYGRGTHTTTRSTLWDLGDDTRVIDTPGIRSFGLWNLTEAELPWYFPEFAAIGGCKFRDCSHTHEPGCAIKQAVETGELSPDRYDTYLRILETIR